MKSFKITTKSLGLFCLSLSIIVSVALIANFSLVTAQNNTIIQQSAQISK